MVVSPCRDGVMLPGDAALLRDGCTMAAVVPAIKFVGSEWMGPQA